MISSAWIVCFFDDLWLHLEFSNNFQWRLCSCNCYWICLLTRSYPLCSECFKNFNMSSDILLWKLFLIGMLLNSLYTSSSNGLKYLHPWKGWNHTCFFWAYRICWGRRIDAISSFQESRLFSPILFSGRSAAHAQEYFGLNT